MRDGLRSGKIRAKLEKDKVLASPSRALAHDTPQKCSDLNDPVSPSPSKTLFQKKEDDTMQKGFDLNDPVPVQKDSESENESLGIKFEEKIDGSKGNEYGNTGMGEVVGLTENQRKRRRVDSGEDIEENGAENKSVKMDGLDCKEQIVGRVLRSRSGGEMTSNKSESGGSVVAGKRTQEKDGSGKKMVNVETDESDRQVQRLKKKLKRKRGRPPKAHTSNVVSKEDEGDWMVGNSKKKMKRKRGRPFKVHTSNVVSKEDEGMVPKKKMKRKRGRPFKVHTSNVVSKEDEGDRMVPKKKMKRKRGRPFKVHTSNVVSKEDEGDRMVGNSKKKMMRKRGRPFKVHGSIGVSEKESGKEEIVGSLRKNERAMKLSDNVKQMQDQLMPKGVSPDEENKYGDLETEDTEDSSRLRSKGANTVSSKEKREKEGGKFKQKKRDAKRSRSAAKQLVRDRIVKLLLSAGWTVDYRPRNGREYNDAVYVNPEGRTHWSVTLAYRMFIKQYKDGDHDSKTIMSSSAFTPIPEEELSMLKRVTQKKMGSKKLRQSGKGGKKTGKKRHKESSTPVVNSGGKLLKGRLKGKHSLCEQGNSTMASAMGMPVPVRNRKRLETQNRKRCALLARSSMKGAESDNDGYILYNGKRTVLSWMIDMGTIPLNGKVQYMNQRKTSVMLEGTIARDGIHCDCCSQIFTISDFETHAGSKLCQPFQNIFLETGASLLLCQLDSWNKQEEVERKWFHFVDVDGEDPNDDTCGLCGDGGDLICCDGCPSTFHQNCLDIQNFPSGDWHCIYCSCKFCGMVGRSTYQRNSNDDTTVSALLTCCLCEEKYHKLCIRSRDAVDDDPNSLSFCGRNCREIFERLQMLLGVKHELEEGFSWSFIQRCDSEIHQKIECNSKLAVALSVMDECFLPIFDHRSGVNLIRNILYNCGSNFNRLNYSGFFTAILERGDEIISVASIRIRGNQLAEMPFIGTRHMYRRQGMCSRLLAAIESGLCSLNVGKLVIPAISELRQTWTSVFGFKPIEVSEKKEMRNMNMLVFPGVDMLHKPLLSHPKEVISPSAGTNSSDHMKEHQMMNDVANNCDDSSSEGTAHAHKINDDPTDIKTDSQLPDGSSHDTSEITSETVILTECAADIKCSVQMSSSHDNIEGENKTIMNTLACACNAPKLSEEINEHRNDVSCSIGLASDKNTVDCQLNQHNISELKSKADVVPCIGSAATKCEGRSVLASGDGTESVACEVKREDSIVEHVCCSIGSPEKSLVEPDSKLNQHNISELKDKADMVSCIGSTAPKCEEQFVLASREGTESVACEVKREDSIVKNVSGDKGSLDHSEEFITTQPQDSHIGCKDLETISWMSQDAKDDEHHNSQQFPLTVCTCL